MSYDFRLFRRVAGEDPLTTARTKPEDDELRPPDPEAERKKKPSQTRWLRNILGCKPPKPTMSISPAFTGSRPTKRGGVIATFVLDGHAAQITLFDHRASIRLPYSHAEPATAKEAIAEVWGYLQTLYREGDFLAYDPQLDRVLVLSDGYDDVISTYLRTVHWMRSLPP